jgi:hypothetical protein
MPSDLADLLGGFHMAPTIDAVHGKARAFVEGLVRLPRSARAAVPHGHFARDYNTLRKLALEVAPGLDERLLGKYVGVYETAGGEFSKASYVEIEVYARQIMEVGEATSADPLAASMKAYDVAVIRREHSQAYAPWSEEDDEYLRARFLEGATVDDLVSEFGRKPGAIRSRLRKLGLDMPGGLSGPAAATSQTDQAATGETMSVEPRPGDDGH